MLNDALEQMEIKQEGSMSSLDVQLAQLVQQAKNGDEKAFSQLVERLSNMVSSIALAITKDIAHSEDVTQKVFIKVWQKLHELKNNGSVLPWVRQLTRYTALNHIRDLGGSHDTAMSNENIEILLAQLADTGASQDKALIQWQQNEVLYHLLESLPDESREVVVLFYREEQNSRVVGSLLGISESLVRKRLQRTRAVLKEQILAQYGKVLLASAPLGMSSALVALSVTASPVAAASTGSMLASSQSQWFIKLFAMFGGAVFGGGMALFANNVSAKRALTYFDDPQVVRRLHKERRQTNIWIVLSTVLMSLAYMYTSGWLMPALSFVFLLVGVTRFVLSMAAANRSRLLKQAEFDDSAYQRLVRQQRNGFLGLGLGALGGACGLIWGLILSGRFSQLL
ncbi:RNA polymerase sigma factor [Pseudoalteromonas luteoviolacea]|nr:sigma-70 family RNA polymerase sigma factor [Pseudoalteromonas luteoviolacea]